MNATSTIDTDTPGELPKGKRTIRRTVRGSLCAYIGVRFWANLGEAFDPAAEDRAADWVNGNAA